MFRRAPLADALEAEDVVAVGEDTEALFADDRLLPYDIRANATHLLLTALDGKRSLHLMLMLLSALLEKGQHTVIQRKQHIEQSKCQARQHSKQNITALTFAALALKYLHL